MSPLTGFRRYLEENILGRELIMLDKEYKKVVDDDDDDRDYILEF